MFWGRHISYDDTTHPCNQRLCVLQPRWSNRKCPFDLPLCQINLGSTQAKVWLRDVQKKSYRYEALDIWFHEQKLAHQKNGSCCNFLAHLGSKEWGKEQQWLMASSLGGYDIHNLHDIIQQHCFKPMNAPSCISYVCSMMDSTVCRNNSFQCWCYNFSWFSSHECRSNYLLP